uniref:SPFH domain-containing protein n=1 Tax=Herbidospora sakaeratensis TaxID=564415 RepID=UPI0007820860|nr:SPFH domain-containing protein [Herbidospora sakaeratensis]
MLIVRLLMVVVVFGGLKIRYQVPEGKVGIVWRWSLRTDSEFPSVTPRGLHGWQADTITEGRRGWHMPGVHKVHYVPWTVVPPDQVGLVTAKEGRRRGRGQVVGVLSDQARDAVDDFQNGADFLLGGGYQGLQASVLPGGQHYAINPRLFDVTFAPRTEVPQGSIGLVVAKAGQIPSHDRPFCRPVACENFQDGDAFLAGGGEQGRQLALLPGGAVYDINPVLFDVITRNNVDAQGGGLTSAHLDLVDIPADHVGVVITLAGKISGEPLGPVVPGHSQFREPAAFLAAGGHLGVQQETLGEGVYQLNPWFVSVVTVPTRMITLEWSVKTPSDADNYDVELDRLTVTVQGFAVEMDLTQTLKIPREAAPRLVKEFGGKLISPAGGLGGLVKDRKPVQRFVERVLGATVTSYLSRAASETTIGEFLSRHREVSSNLTDEVRKALRRQGVEPIDTSLGLFQPDAELKEELQKEGKGQLELGRSSQTKDLATKQDEIHSITNNRVKRELANSLEVLIEQLGRDNAVVIQMIEAMSNLPMPSTIMGGDVSGLVQALPSAQVAKLIDGLREQADKRALPGAHAKALGAPKFVLNPDTKEFAVALVLCEARLRDPGPTGPPPSNQQIADTIMELLNFSPGPGVRDHFIREVDLQLTAVRTRIRRARLVPATQQLKTAAFPGLLLDNAVLGPHHLAYLQDRDWLDYQAAEWREGV